jgi:phage terminase large subunit-like protein
MSSPAVLGEQPPAAIPAEGATSMTGSSLALITIPIVGPAGLIAWLIMVFRADSHPRRYLPIPRPRRAGRSAARHRISRR